VSITVTLVGSVPQLAQIVVSATTLGVAWEVTGSAGGQEWTVPGGVGIGDGNQLTLVDNRAPLNTPITYTYTPATGSAEVASAVTVTSAFAIILQALDGQGFVGVDLLDGSSRMDLAPDQGVFRVPGRRRPVVRYSVTGDGGGVLNVGMDADTTAVFRELTLDGAPLLVRRQAMDDDMPLVFVALFTSLSSVLFQDIGYRQWELGFLYVDDPYLDVRLGAYSWDTFDSELAGRDWDLFDTTMAGRTWNEFDTLDWEAV
jgi:hypothetical protein